MSKVKSIIKYTAILAGSEKVAKEYKRSEELFDLKGNLIYQKYFDEYGNSESIITFKYSDNKLIERNSSIEENELSERKTFAYNDNGKLIKEATSYQDGHTETRILVIDGSIEKWQLKDENNELIGSEDIIYDDSGLELSRNKKDEQNEIHFDSNKSYNAKGQLIEHLVFTDGDFGFRTTLEYNPDELVSKQTHFYENGEVLEKVIFQYNERGQCTEEKAINNIIKSYYNEDGLLERKETIHTSGKMIEAFEEYTYNEAGLVIEESSFQMGATYELEPGVVARSSSEHLRTRYEYEFWDEALVYAPSL